MWDKHEADKNIKKLGLPPRGKSEPDLFIENMDTLEGGAVIVCLVGGGQEINKGEDGLIEWVKSIKTKFPHWNVFAAPEIKTEEYLGNMSADTVLDVPNKIFIDEKINRAIFFCNSRKKTIKITANSSENIFCCNIMGGLSLIHI